MARSRNGAPGCLTGGMGAKYYVLGYIYRFSKRTEVFAAYYNLDNRAAHARRSVRARSSPRVPIPLAPASA